jgi:hypothetical protein
MSERDPNINPPTLKRSNLPLEVADDDIQHVAQVELQTTPHDDAPIAETNALEIERLELRLEEIRQGQATAKDVHFIRKAYVLKLFILICCWLGVTAMLLILAGLGAWGFNLSEKVLIALVTSTVPNVLGLFYVVAKWLYPAPAPEPKGKTWKAEISKTKEE